MLEGSGGFVSYLGSLGSLDSRTLPWAVSKQSPFPEPYPSRVEWVLIDLSNELSPCFKLFVDDPDNDINVESEAQIFLSSATRTVRFSNGALESVRIPDAILRIGIQDDESLIHALNSLSNQWDALFS